MNRPSAPALPLIIFLTLLSFSAQSAPAQERELPLDRILNPMPDFDPFEKPPDAPRFFPDEVDKRAREALIDVLTGRDEALADHVKFFKSRDAKLSNERETTTGLTGHVRDLAANTIRDRERYLAALKQALEEAATPEQKKYLETIIKNDDLNQAENLLKKSSANRWGGFLNRMLSSVDLVSIVTGSYIGAAVDSTMNQMFALADKEMPIEERRALARIHDHLKRYPYHPRNPEIWKLVDGLEGKKKNALAQKQLNQATEAEDKKALQKALFHYELAALLAPKSSEAEESVQRAVRRYQEQEEARKNALIADVENERPAAERQDAKRLLQALSLRDEQEIERLAAEMKNKYRGQPLAASAEDASAVALEMKGRHEEAKKIIARLASSSDAPQEQKRAAALLESPEYNLLASFDAARSQRRLETVKYVLLGEDLLRKNLIYGTGPLIASGPAGAATLGAANIIMIGTNLFQVLTNNPVSSEAVIDKGVAYIRNHPNSESATEVYEVLAQAFEERGLYDTAIKYYQLAGAEQEQKIAEIKEKAAKTLLNAANKSSGRSAQEYYLKTILDDYPESSVAEQATQKLATLVKSENHGLRMSKQFLIENPELYGPQGLGLKAALFDRNLNNMELADRGVNILNDREILVHYQTPWGTRSQEYPLPRQTSERFFMALRQKNLEVALADADRRAKGSVGGIMNVPLAVLRGQTEPKGGQAAEQGDTTMTLVREAGGPAPTFPKVLDHELLSENERDPSSKYRLPPIQGSVSASRFDLSGALPTGLWGNRLSFGADPRSPFAGVQLPIPLLEGFVPVDFMIQGRPGRFSVFPKIHMFEDKGADQELYR